MVVKLKKKKHFWYYRKLKIKIERKKTTRGSMYKALTLSKLVKLHNMHASSCFSNFHTLVSLLRPFTSLPTPDHQSSNTTIPHKRPAWTIYQHWFSSSLSQSPSFPQATTHNWLLETPSYYLNLLSQPSFSPKTYCKLL